MDDLTCCGLPLKVFSQDEISQPLEALVIVKTMEADGTIAHRVLLTDGLSQVEALGYAHFADEYLREQIRKGMRWDSDT